jgi:hypothetical protein
VGVAGARVKRVVVGEGREEEEEEVARRVLDVHAGAADLEGDDGGGVRAATVILSCVDSASDVGRGLRWSFLRCCRCDGGLVDADLDRGCDQEGTRSGLSLSGARRCLLEWAASNSS